MLAPDVELDDGKGTILISSEEGETTGKEEVGGTWLGGQGSFDELMACMYVCVCVCACARVPLLLPNKGK